MKKTDEAPKFGERALVVMVEPSLLQGTIEEYVLYLFATTVYDYISILDSKREILGRYRRK
jgi:hypothetical protein